MQFAVPVVTEDGINKFTAAIVQWLERLIVVQDVEGSNPSSRPILFSPAFP